jgi:5-methylcytosine-specific restriction protein A
MANAPLRPCSEPRCSQFTTTDRCAQHARIPDQRRANVDLRRLYRTARWRRLRTLVLSEEPLCCDCIANGAIAASTDVDHQVPHRGDLDLFWSRGNLRGRCHSCHSKKTQRGE